MLIPGSGGSNRRKALPPALLMASRICLGGSVFRKLNFLNCLRKSKNFLTENLDGFLPHSTGSMYNPRSSLLLALKGWEPLKCWNSREADVTNQRRCDIRHCNETRSVLQVLPWQTLVNQRSLFDCPRVKWHNWHLHGEPTTGNENKKFINREVWSWCNTKFTERLIGELMFWERHE